MSDEGLQPLLVLCENTGKKGQPRNGAGYSIATAAESFYAQKD